MRIITHRDGSRVFSDSNTGPYRRRRANRSALQYSFGEIWHQQQHCERHATRLGQPKSQCDQSTFLMEILRQAGLDTERLRNLGASPADSDVVRFAISMAGLELGCNSL